MDEFRILIADDHIVVRHGISAILKESFENLTISHAATFLTAIEMLRQQAFELIVLDISIPDGKGTQMIEMIRAIQPGMRILVFSAHEEDLYAVRYLKAGASGYLNKLSSEQEFKKAFLSMMEEGHYWSESIQKKMAENQQSDNPLELLSNRELEIARFLAKGDGNLEIANKLILQNSTVSTYKNRIFEKLNITNTVALAELFKIYGSIFD